MVYTISCDTENGDVLLEQIGINICSINAVKWEASAFASIILLTVNIYILLKWKKSANESNRPQQPFTISLTDMITYSIFCRYLSSDIKFCLTPSQAQRHEVRFCLPMTIVPRITYNVEVAQKA
ncbi:hypothetical protein GQX74_010273 [Glossina fuscipes]|uniref:Uncharacterized protein n=1 Tax=Glossina palpalis gambiensis TaxID=67801 RepID=A0A1B0ATA5_9MUSC|nr:hypothetical protein GQX74_010273 [Glossina fuscipes]